MSKKNPPHFIIKINPINFSYLFMCSRNPLQYIKYLLLALVSVRMSASVIWSIFVTKIFALFLITGYNYIISQKYYSLYILS